MRRKELLGSSFCLFFRSPLSPPKYLFILNRMEVKGKQKKNVFCLVTLITRHRWGVDFGVRFSLEKKRIAPCGLINKEKERERER